MSIYSQEKIFYVYQYLRKKISKNGPVGSPYYIGKGHGDRAFVKDKRNFKPPKDKSRIQFVSENLTEEDAFNLEIELIAKYGRIDKGTGCLQNRTNGGDGTSGLIHSKLHIKRIRETKIKNGTLNNITPESIAKRKATQLKRYGTLNTSSPEANIKRIATRKANGNMNTNTPESIAKGLETKRIKGSLLNHITEEALQKQRETKIKNNSLTSNPDIKAKIKATKIKNGTVGGTSEGAKKAWETKRRNGTDKPSPETIVKANPSRALTRAKKKLNKDK